MDYLIYLIIIIFGLIIGSFLNCVIYRLHIKKSFLGGRSFCPHCHHQLAWYDNLPVLSFIILKRRCRYCHQPISWQYPLVEIATAILFLLVYVATFGYGQNLILTSTLIDWIILFRNWFLTAILILIFIYDLKYYLILDKIILPAIVLFLFINLFIVVLQSDLLSVWKALFNYLLAAAVVGGFFLIQFIISQGRWIGGGDIRLGALMGVSLGWPQALVALLIAYVGGSIIGLILIITRYKKMNSSVPLGTFIAPAVWLVMLWGPTILAWYQGLIFN